jgi:hypothetical protein
MNSLSELNGVVAQGLFEITTELKTPLGEWNASRISGAISRDLDVIYAGVKNPAYPSYHFVVSEGELTIEYRTKEGKVVGKLVVKIHPLGESVGTISITSRAAEPVQQLLWK